MLAPNDLTQAVLAGDHELDQPRVGRYRDLTFAAGSVAPEGKIGHRLVALAQKHDLAHSNHPFG